MKKTKISSRLLVCAVLTACFVSACSGGNGKADSEALSGKSVEMSETKGEKNSMTNEKTEKQGVYRSITMDEAKEIFAKPGEYRILDVRRADEFAAGHIPGAINIANEEIQTERPDELPDTEQTIYVYCRSGRRSKEASQKLADMGYTGIVECGGILDWKGEIVTESAR